MHKLSYEELEDMAAEGRQKIRPGSRWRHYKGTEYIISDIAIIEANDEVAVIYTSVSHPSVSFVRPVSVWLETATVDGNAVPRFVELS